MRGGGNKYKAVKIKERDVQRQIVEDVRAKFPTVLIHHSPNGIRASWSQVKAVKEDGLLKGWPDLCLIWPGAVAWFEVKRPGVRKTTEEQAAFIETVRGYGFKAAVVNKPEEAMNLLTEWGAPRGKVVEI